MFVNWLFPILFSALTLGIYDLCKKSAVKNNAVMPVLFLATASGTLFFVLLTLLTGNIIQAVRCDMTTYILTLLKATIVSGSWVCVFYAMRELPITLASPLRATSPLWTAVGGILIYNEIPAPVQAVGMFIILIGYILFNFIGKSEGFNWKSKGIILIVAGTLLGAFSALYDNRPSGASILLFGKSGAGSGNCIAYPNFFQKDLQFQMEVDHPRHRNSAHRSRLRLFLCIERG